MIGTKSDSKCTIPVVFVILVVVVMVTRLLTFCNVIEELLLVFKLHLKPE